MRHSAGVRIWMWLVWCLLMLGGVAPAGATPSTQVWIPSTDVQPFSRLHLTFDSYVRADEGRGGTRLPPVVVVGPTIGVLPWEKLQAEVGADALFQGNAALDRHPVYFHAKLGTPEDSVFAWSPALAAGMYNIGTKPRLTTQNVLYGLAAHKIPFVGRLSAGYYLGNDAVLVDETGAASAHGVLASWDRTMSEISDKLWLAIDFQGGRNALSTLNAGVSWAFSDNVSVILGYDFYLNAKVAGQDTLTFQVDINL